MQTKKVVTIILLLFVVVSAVVLISSEMKSDAQAILTGSDDSNGAEVTVYYFHHTQRCPTCIKIEKLAHAVVTSDLAEQLDDGRVQWKVLNVDEPEHAHFVADYQLVSQALVLVDRHPDTTTWKSLDRIWELVDDSAAFADYVRTETLPLLHL